MTPLAPLYLLGALAIAGPILFHLWRRTPRGRREFSTLMFLTPSPPRITSRSRIEHWLLLLLRGAALCLLALAFARPFWRTTAAEVDRSGDAELVALLIDSSASTQRAGVWTEIRRLVDRRLEQASPSATIGLFQFDDQWREVLGFEALQSTEASLRRGLVKEKLTELQPGWGGTNLGEGLIRTVASLHEMQGRFGKQTRLRIIVASDLTVGTKLDALSSFEWPSDISLEILTAQSGSPTNAGLQLVERNLDMGDDQIRVRVTNAADSKRENFVLRWDGDAQSDMLVYVPPGQSRVLVAPERPQQEGRSSLVLSGDDHDFDNQVFVPPKRTETQRVVFCGTDKADDINGLRFYLDRVYSASQRFQIEVIDWQETLAADKAERPALIVLVEPEEAATAVVQAQLARGGGVLIVAKSVEQGDACLKQCRIAGLTLSEATVRRDALLSEIEFAHPLFAPFAESQFSDFTGIRFWHHRAVSGTVRLADQAGGDEGIAKKPPSEAEAATAKPLGTIIAKFDDDAVALTEIPVGRGRVWLMMAGWHPSDSQLARSSKFPPLMYRLLELASGAVVRPESVVVGTPIPWPAHDGEGDSLKGTARGPNGLDQSDLPTESPFTGATRPGLYTLKAGDRSETIAVNLGAEESRTAPLSLERLESLGIPLGKTATPSQLAKEQARLEQLKTDELERSQKLWRWVLLAVIGVLVLETWLAGRRGNSVEGTSLESDTIGSTPQSA